MACRFVDIVAKLTFAICCVNFALLIYTGKNIGKSVNNRFQSSDHTSQQETRMFTAKIEQGKYVSEEGRDLLDYGNDTISVDPFNRATNTHCDLTKHFSKDKWDIFPFTKNQLWPQKEDFLCEPKLEHFSKRTLLIFVESAPKNFEMRSFIRQTWALHEYYAMNNVRTPFTLAVIFVIGIPDATSRHGQLDDIIQVLNEEIENNGDILLLNMSDHYDHLTYKGIASLTWVNNTVSEKVQNILKTDDDSFVNAMGWMSIIVRLKRVTKSSKYIVGTNCAYRARVIRDPKVKRNPVTFKEYKSRFYPPYCMGSGYLMSRDAMVDMLNAIQDVPFLKVEDVYFTGLVAMKAHITRYWTSGITEKESRNVWQLGSSTKNMPLIIHHMPRKYPTWQSLWHLNQDAYDTSALNWNTYPVKYFAGPRDGVDMLK